MNFAMQLQIGYRYLKSWPLQPELGFRFPENRVIMATNLGIKLMPLIAVLTVLSPIVLQRMDLLSQSVFMACVFLSLPVHGLLWLSKRAETILPLSLVGWYVEIKIKLQEAGDNISDESPLRYRHLAQLLTKVYCKPI